MNVQNCIVPKPTYTQFIQTSSTRFQFSTKMKKIRNWTGGDDDDDDGCSGGCSRMGVGFFFFFDCFDLVVVGSNWSLSHP
jgi:hypothetical protein